MRFDAPYYLENVDHGTLTLRFGEETAEVPLKGYGGKAKIALDVGEVQVQIPRIRLLLDGQAPPPNALWKGDISPSSRLRVLCSDFLNASVCVGGVSLVKTDALGGFEYALGNAVQAYDGIDCKVPVALFVAGEKHFLFDVVFKPCLTAPPSFHLNGSMLVWMNPHAFVGDRATNLKITFQPKRGMPIVAHVEQGNRIVSTCFPERPDRYAYKITAITETAFGPRETLVDEDSIILGDREEVIFRGETLRVTRVIEDGNYIEIKPFYIKEIRYIGKENLGYTDLNGEYAHFAGKISYIANGERRYFSELNPIDIFLVNEAAGRVHLSFDEGAGLFVDQSCEHLPELCKRANPPQRLARFFSIPDYFEFDFCKEIYEC